MPHSRRVLGPVFVATMALSFGASAADFYVDPQSGSMTNDGSASKPYKTLQEVIAANLVATQGWESLPYAAGKQLVAKNAGAPIKAGDTIWLRSGYHGEVQIVGHYNAQMITIAAEAGHTPELGSLVIQAGKNWKISGLHVSPELAPSYSTQTLIQLDSHNHQGPVSDIVVEGCTLYSKKDVSAWTDTDWDQLSANGISADGTNITIRNNQLENVNFGISVSASDSLVEHNVIDSFAGDGLRGLGDDTTFQYNVVKNCYDVNANHDDGFQSWSNGPGGVGSAEVRGIVLRGNLIINYEDENQKYRGTLQGIGCFDGTFVDWVVENNVIITDHWHGITLLGAENVRVVNNTVIDRNTESPGPPWIQVGNHKNGTAPIGCLVRNNLVTDLNNASSGVTEDHNLLIDDASKFFVNAAAFDLHLLPNAPAVDTGSADQAPSADIEGIPRPQGSGVDVGAYEWHDGSVTPDGGLGGGGSAGASGSGTGGGAGASSGGSSGTGATGSGGSNASGGSGGSSAGSSNAADSGEDDGGCGCRVPSAPASSGWLAAVVILLIGAAARRRRDARAQT